MLRLLRFCWGGQWVDENFSRLLCGRWPLQRLLPSLLLEDTTWCWTPVEKERASKRTAVYLDSLVTESLRSQLRLRDRVRTRCWALSPMSLSRSWKKRGCASNAASATVVVASGSGLLRLLHKGLHSACSACIVRTEPLGTSELRRGVYLFETGCDNGGCTSCKKRFESTFSACSACTVSHPQEVQWWTHSVPILLARSRCDAN